jgi:hypothetical protein
MKLAVLDGEMSSGSTRHDGPAFDQSRELRLIVPPQDHETWDWQGLLTCDTERIRL